MSRLFPHPILTLGLIVFWLILQQSFSLGHILLGTIIGIGAGLATSTLGLQKPKLKKPWLIPQLFLIVTIDIIRSNLAVAWIILTQGEGPKKAQFLEIPLDLRDPNGLAFLSIIITSTPGTVWVEYDDEASTLLLHILDVIDEQEWIDTIKNRYERLLLEILA
jgi:multicomponent K+:H+ antiporter subunit E